MVKPVHLKTEFPVNAETLDHWWCLRTLCQLANLPQVMRPTINFINPAEYEVQLWVSVVYGPDQMAHVLHTPIPGKRASGMAGMFTVQIPGDFSASDAAPDFQVNLRKPSPELPDTTITALVYGTTITSELSDLHRGFVLRGDA